MSLQGASRSPTRATGCSDRPQESSGSFQDFPRGCPDLQNASRINDDRSMLLHGFQRRFPFLVKSGFNGASRSLSSQVHRWRIYAGVIKLIKSIGFFNILAILSAHKVLDVPTWSKRLPRGLQEAPRSPRETPQGGPKSPPRGPKLAPRGSKMPQDGPRRAQDTPRAPREAPRCPPAAPKRPQDDPNIAPRSLQGPPRGTKMAPRRPQEAPRAPQMTRRSSKQGPR